MQVVAGLPNTLSGASQGVAAPPPAQPLSEDKIGWLTAVLPGAKTLIAAGCVLASVNHIIIIIIVIIIVVIVIIVIVVIVIFIVIVVNFTGLGGHTGHKTNHMILFITIGQVLMAVQVSRVYTVHRNGGRHPHALLWPCGPGDVSHLCISHVCMLCLLSAQTASNLGRK